MVIYGLGLAINADLLNCHENFHAQAQHLLPQPSKDHKEVETKYPGNSLVFKGKILVWEI